MGNVAGKYVWQPKSLMFGIFFLLCISTLLAQMAYLIKPIDGDTPMNDVLSWMSIEEAQAKDALWVDARSAADFEKSHVPGAVNMSMDDWMKGFAEFSAEWRPGRIVIVYCSGGGCMASEDVALRLKRVLPNIDVRVLKGGYPVWLRQH